MNNKQFYIKLKQCISSIFSEIDKKEDLFEFGIFTDQDVSTLLVGYNTYTHFATQLEKYFLKENKIVSHYRWSMPEWKGNIGDGNSHLDEINDILYNIIQPREAELNPDNFKDILLDLLFNALIELKTEGVFGVMKANSILYLT